MPPTKLADTREMTLDDARACFADLAQAEIQITKQTAAAEARIARLKAEFDAQVVTQRGVRDALAGRLRDFILAHPDQFRKPRAIATDFGRFGRRSVSNVQVSDFDALRQWARDNAHLDCLLVIERPVKPAIAVRLRDGQTVPGCAIVEGEEAFYNVDRELLDAAKQQ